MGKRKGKALLAVGFLTALAACGAGRGARDTPTPSLATSAGASYELAEIRAAWRTRTLEGRIELRDRLERFLLRFPSDGASPLARVYLALVYLDAGDLQRAERELVALTKLPTGATRDFAEVARAEAERARGRPGDALERLRPLAGKMADRDARERTDEAIVLAALEARREYEALAYMDAWIRNAEPADKDAVRERVRASVARMNGAVLVPALTAMRRKDAPAGYGRDLQRLVTARVAEFAVEQNDAKLAQWLVDANAGAVLDDSTEILVAELATRQAGGTAFIGRTVGLVLPTSSSSLRDAAGDVARGIAWALELPRASETSGDETRLATRDDSGKRGELESKLEELAAEGAGVIVAGFDEAAAERAVRWSEATGVVVIVLAAPSKTKPRTSSFVLGEPVERVTELLASALAARRESKIAIVSDRASLGAVAATLASRKSKFELFQPAPCEIEEAQGADARFPVDAWEKEKFRTWLVAGPDSCGRALLREIGHLDGALVAFTLEATGRVERGATAASVLSAGAGFIPLLPSTGDGASRTLVRPQAGGRATGERERKGAGRVRRPGASARADLDAFVATLGSVPTWRVALGRDAGLLARLALRTLPKDAAATEEEVLRRRDVARQIILSTKETFWSSEATSVDHVTHTLPRTLRVVDLR